MTLSRRTLLAAGGGLLVSFRLHAAEQGGTPPSTSPAPLPGSLKQASLLDAWIKVAPDGHITVYTGKAELGQGIGTAILQVAAEQLDVSPRNLELVTADTGRTPNEGFTAGSHSMQDSATAVMNATAQVRSLLVQQAATEWGLPPDTLTTRDGAVHGPDGRILGYGVLAAGMNLHVEAQPNAPLKSPADYKVIGASLPRIDIPAKVTGGPAYVQDLRLPGMLHARAVRQPSPGAKLLDFDTTPIERMPGVVKLIREGSYLAVVTDKEWQAVKAWRALSAAAQWQETASLPDQATMPDALKSLPAKDISVLASSGPAAAPVKRVSARYSRPYLMHGAIGPSCAVARLDGDTMTVWTHTQGVYPLRAALAQLLRMSSDKVRCIQTPGSGCYGHNGADDAAGDAALIAQALPGRPIRVQWMREQEHTSEPYGTAMLGELSAALDADGRITEWTYDVWTGTHNRRPTAGGLMLQNAALPEALPVPPPSEIPMPEGGGDRNSNPIYALPNARVTDHFIAEMPLRVSALRSLGAFLNVFAIESFMDELAEAAGTDAVAFRLKHLADDRAKAVVQTAADRFGWSAWKPRTAGEGRGFAFARYKNLGAYCALAVTARVERETGEVRLGRVVAAVDSGQPVNPDGIRNQIEGAIIQAASWTLYEQVRSDRRHVTSMDWSSYPILRFPAVPESIEVHVLPRPGQPFLGTGEAGQGPAAAAIANAIRSAAGVRLRDLPLSAEKVKQAIGV